MHDTDYKPYPLLFEPIYKEKVWGGRSLTRLGKTLPGDENTLIGESWELADLPGTSTSGGGGDPARSQVINGPWAGRTLNDLIRQFGENLLGRLPATDTGDFPLLVKFLDARQNLSVQVHPSPDYAAKHADAHLKTEAWYVLHAEPGAVIYKGIHDGVTPDDLRKAIEANDQAAVEKLLISVPVKPGQCHFLPSGVCHALGAGIVVAEVQTPSDTTFRVFDWGRTDRELHVEPALECIEFHPPRVERYEKRSHIAGIFTTVTHLVACDFFRIEKVRMSEGYQQEIPYDQPTVWMVLQGSAEIDPGNGQSAVTAGMGQTLLLPAGLDQATVKLHADTTWLEVTFPQAMNQQIA